MRLPRIRFTIGTFMLGLAITTVLIVVGVKTATWMRWREFYLDRAEYHEEKEQTQRQYVKDLAQARSRGLDTHPLFAIGEDLARRRLTFHTAMGLKWRKAVANPWADVSDDPDEPTDDRIVKKFDLPRGKYITDDVQYFDPASVRTSAEVSSP